MPARLQTTATGYACLAGVGGIGTGLFFALEGDHTLGRNESRPGRLLDVRDYCKLHIIAHYVAAVLGADPSGKPFRVLPIGKVGTDAPGERLVREMSAAGMDTRFVEQSAERPTLMSACFQYPDGSGGNITTNNSAAAALTSDDVNAVEEILQDNQGRFVALAAPEAPLEPRRALLELATKYRGLRAAAFTSAEIEEARALGIFDLVDLVSLNEDEGAALCGEKFDAGRNEPFLEVLEKSLAARDREIMIVLSAGKAGAYAFDEGRWDFAPAADLEVVSTAGAGDALLGGVIAALAAGLPLAGAAPAEKFGGRPLECALDFGILLAAFSVTSPHTIHPDARLETLVDFAARLNVPLGTTLTEKFAD